MTVDGKEIFTLKDEELTIFRRRKIGFVFQNYNLVPVLNVYENILLPVQLDGGSPDQTYINEIIDTLGLASKLANLPNNLSGGQQQRVAIARAIAQAPPIILADEPTGNLDSNSTKEIMQILRELHSEGRTVILITHDNEIAEQADRVIQIRDGKIVADTRQGAVQSRETENAGNKNENQDKTGEDKDNA